MTVAKLVPSGKAQTALNPEPFLEWTPLGARQPIAPQMPVELLPPTLRPWVCDISDRMQVPIEMVAVPALVAIAGVVGRRVAIHPKANDDWLVVPNLWGGIVARPGKMKSPVLAEALGPLRSLAADARKAHQESSDVAAVRIESLRAKEGVIKGRLKKVHEGKGTESEANLEEQLVDTRQEIRRQEEASEEQRYVVNDTTVEKLGELLRSNPLGLLLERDELAGWLRSLERDDRRGDREFFLEAWNGKNPYTYDRIGRGTIRVPALCLSIVGGIQPAKLSRFVSDALDGGYAADGLLQRFQLLVWPEDDGDWTLVDRTPDVDASEAAFGAFARLAALEGPDLNGEIPARRFAPDAQEMFFTWLSGLEERIRSKDLVEMPAYESHLAKYRSLMPSLSLLFHLVEVADSSVPVSLDAAKLGADWCDFLDQHARKVYAAEVQPGLPAAHALAAKIRDGAVVDGMTVREVYNAGWSRLKSAEAVQSAVAVLERNGWARIVVQKTGGRPKHVLAINPEVRETRG